MIGQLATILVSDWSRYNHITLLISDWSRSRAELESVAEDYHRGLASLEFSHYNLKSEYDKVCFQSIMFSI